MGERMPKDGRDRKIQRSSTMPLSLVMRARGAVYWTRNVPGEPASYSELNRRGVLDQVERLEKLYNNGEHFEDPGKLSPGPAPGVMEEVARMRRVAKDAKEARLADENADHSSPGSGPGGEPDE